MRFSTDSFWGDSCHCVIPVTSGNSIYFEMHIFPSSMYSSFVKRKSRDIFKLSRKPSELCKSRRITTLLLHIFTIVFVLFIIIIFLICKWDAGNIYFFIKPSINTTVLNSFHPIPFFLRKKFVLPAHFGSILAEKPLDT